MSRHPRIEEVEDDPEEFDITDYDPRSRSPNAASPAASTLNPFINPSDIPSASTGSNTKFISESESAAYKGYQVIYPIYFDITRSREQGRRVNKEYAVENPLAREIVDCCTLNGLKTVFEPTKIHPKDWANPGRVRVLLKENGVGMHPEIKNKRQLLQIIGSYLKAHPTTEQTPLKLRFPHMPAGDKPAPPPAVPRGWKLNPILPLHSPALTGGGISDNFLKDMMKEMEGAGGAPGGMGGLAGLQNMFGGMGGGMGGMPGLGESSSAGGDKKKEKKKGKK
ncbi:signal recognition particle, SRP19 subunit [Kalaharituber pfeilii]|nr:signal recognition particle, SRP19 subunit [Kalaharituber pfeilii]